MSADKKVFEQGKCSLTSPAGSNTDDRVPGYQPPVQQQHQTPGQQGKMDPQPSIEHVPDEKGGYKLYQAAGKLKGRKALITGGDSGIGQSTAVLFAMEGCSDIFFQHLPEEKSDAKKTVELVEKYGAKAHTFAADLTDKNNCKRMVDEALSKMGAINILFNNHAYQMMIHDIHDLKEEQWEHTFNTNIHGKFS